MLTKISSALDVIADRLEKKGLIKEAYEIDRVADEIERQIDFTKPRSIMDSEFKNIPLPTALPKGQSISERNIQQNLEELSNIAQHIHTLCWYPPKAELFKKVSSDFISALKKLLAQTTSEEFIKVAQNYSVPIRNLMSYMNSNLPSLGQDHGFSSKSHYVSGDALKASVKIAIDIFHKFINWAYDMSDAQPNT